jgi:hypothetical protein
LQAEKQDQTEVALMEKALFGIYFKAFPSGSFPVLLPPAIGSWWAHQDLNLEPTDHDSTRTQFQLRNGYQRASRHGPELCKLKLIFQVRHRIKQADPGMIVSMISP